jgi:GxxExxY protein
MAVHRQLGSGFLEPVYQDALEVEFSLKGIPARREVHVPIFYKNRQLRTSYRPDLECFDDVVVELKALNRLGSREKAQVIGYLKAARRRVGLLVNFGASELEYKRLVYG